MECVSSSSSLASSSHHYRQPAREVDIYREERSVYDEQNSKESMFHSSNLSSGEPQGRRIFLAKKSTTHQTMSSSFASSSLGTRVHESPSPSSSLPGVSAPMYLYHSQQGGLSSETTMYRVGATDSDGYRGAGGGAGQVGDEVGFLRRGGKEEVVEGYSRVYNAKSCTQDLSAPSRLYHNEGYANPTLRGGGGEQEESRLGREMNDDLLRKRQRRYHGEREGGEERESRRPYYPYHDGSLPSRHPPPSLYDEGGSTLRGKAEGEREGDKQRRRDHPSSGYAMHPEEMWPTSGVIPSSTGRREGANENNERQKSGYSSEMFLPSSRHSLIPSSSPFDESNSSVNSRRDTNGDGGVRVVSIHYKARGGGGEAGGVHDVGSYYAQSPANHDTSTSFATSSPPVGSALTPPFPSNGIKTDFSSERRREEEKEERTEQSDVVMLNFSSSPYYHRHRDETGDGRSRGGGGLREGEERKEEDLDDEERRRIRAGRKGAGEEDDHHHPHGISDRNYHDYDSRGTRATTNRYNPPSSSSQTLMTQSTPPSSSSSPSAVYNPFSSSPSSSSAGEKPQTSCSAAPPHHPRCSPCIFFAAGICRNGDNCRKCHYEEHRNPESPLYSPVYVHREGLCLPCADHRRHGNCPNHEADHRTTLCHHPSHIHEKPPDIYRHAGCASQSSSTHAHHQSQQEQQQKHPYHRQRHTNSTDRKGLSSKNPHYHHASSSSRASSYTNQAAQHSHYHSAKEARNDKGKTFSSSSSGVGASSSSSFRGMSREDGSSSSSSSLQMLDQRDIRVARLANPAIAAVSSSPQATGMTRNTSSPLSSSSPDASSAVSVPPWVSKGRERKEGRGGGGGEERSGGLAPAASAVQAVPISLTTLSAGLYVPVAYPAQPQVLTPQDQTPNPQQETPSSSKAVSMSSSSSPRSSSLSLSLKSSSNLTSSSPMAVVASSSSPPSIQFYVAHPHHATGAAVQQGGVDSQAPLYYCSSASSPTAAGSSPSSAPGGYYSLIFPSLSSASLHIRREEEEKRAKGEKGREEEDDGGERDEVRREKEFGNGRGDDALSQRTTDARDDGFLSKLSKICRQGRCTPCVDFYTTGRCEQSDCTRCHEECHKDASSFLYFQDILHRTRRCKPCEAFFRPDSRCPHELETSSPPSASGFPFSSESLKEGVSIKKFMKMSGNREELSGGDRDNEKDGRDHHHHRLNERRWSLCCRCCHRVEHLALFPSSKKRPGECRAPPQGDFSFQPVLMDMEYYKIHCAPRPASNVSSMNSNSNHSGGGKLKKGDSSRSPGDSKISRSSPNLLPQQPHFCHRNDRGGREGERGGGSHPNALSHHRDEHRRRDSVYTSTSSMSEWREDQQEEEEGQEDDREYERRRRRSSEDSYDHHRYLPSAYSPACKGLPPPHTLSSRKRTLSSTQQYPSSHLSSSFSSSKEKRSRMGMLGDNEDIALPSSRRLHSSAHHPEGCEPCARYFCHIDGCNLGKECRFCHHEDHRDPDSPLHPTKLLHELGRCIPCRYMAKTGHCSNSDPYEEEGKEDDSVDDEKEEKQSGVANCSGMKRRNPEDFSTGNSSCPNGKRSTSSLCGFCHHEDHRLRRSRKEEMMTGDHEEEGMKEKRRAEEKMNMSNDYRGHGEDDDSKKKTGELGEDVKNEEGGEKKIDDKKTGTRHTDDGRGQNGEKIESEEDRMMKEVKKGGEEEEERIKKKRKRRVKFFKQRGHFDADAHDRGVCIPCAYYFIGEEGCLASSKHREGICRYCHDGDHANPHSPAHPSKLLHFKGVCTPCTALQKGTCKRTAETCIFCHHEDHLLPSSSAAPPPPRLTASSPKTDKKETRDLSLAQEEGDCRKGVRMKREKGEEEKRVIMKKEKRDREQMDEDDDEKEGEEEDTKVRKGGEERHGGRYFKDEDDEEQEEGEVKEGVKEEEIDRREEITWQKPNVVGWIKEEVKEEEKAKEEDLQFESSDRRREDSRHQSSDKVHPTCPGKEILVHMGQDSSNRSIAAKDVGKLDEVEEKKEEREKDAKESKDARMAGIAQNEEEEEDDDVTTTSTSHEKMGASLQKKRDEGEEKEELSSSEDDANAVGLPMGELKEGDCQQEGHGEEKQEEDELSFQEDCEKKIKDEIGMACRVPYDQLGVPPPPPSSGIEAETCSLSC